VSGKTPRIAIRELNDYPYVFIDNHESVGLNQFRLIVSAWIFHSVALRVP